jgi:hypothetical protein
MKEFKKIYTCFLLFIAAAPLSDNFTHQMAADVRHLFPWIVLRLKRIAQDRLATRAETRNERNL